MDGPGMSLFNGAGSIHLNTSAQRLEEEEAIEDQKRRNEELQNDLKNCFDDFIDDEDDSVNDSSHFISMNMTHLSRNNAAKGFDNNPLNLQTELMQSESNSKKSKLGDPSRNPGHAKITADVDRDSVHPMTFSKQRVTQNELLNHNGFNEINRQPVDNSPKYQSPAQGQFQGEDMTEHYQHFYQAPITGGFENLRYIPGQSNTEFTSGNNRQNDDQLQVFYQMRVHEVQRLSEELEACRRDATASHDALYGRLAVAEAERERAQLSLHQSQELVANSKHRITELEHQVSSLNSKIGSMSARNEELNAQVMATTASLMDTQRRLQSAKMTKESSQSTDALFKAQQERYKEDTNQLEKDLMKTRNKLQEKENSILALESRYRDLERSKEELLIDKGSTINKLAMELEEAQNRLAANETSELKEKISQLIVERNTARLQFKDMAGKLEATATELVDYRTKFIRLQEEQSELEAVLEQLSEVKESDSFTQLKSSKTGRGFSSQADKVALLRNELTKAVGAQKLKNEQIEKLNKTLQQKDQLIETFKDAEARFKRDIEHFKDNEVKKSEELKSVQAKLDKSSAQTELLESLKSQCAELESELKKTTSELTSLLSKHSSLEAKYEEVSSELNCRNSADRQANIEVIKERDKLLYQLKDAQKQIDEFKNMYVEVCGIKEKISKELCDLRSKDIYEDLKKKQSQVDELKELLEKEKSKVEEISQHLLEQQVKQFDDHLKNYQLSMDASNMTSKEKSSLSDRQLEITNQLKAENQKLKQLCEEQTEQLNRLIVDLEESKKVTAKLNTEVELQGERDRLIADLKEKGKQFEQYIQSQQAKLFNRRDACTSPLSGLAKDDVAVSVKSANSRDSSKINVTQQVNLRMEEIIREEVAQHFAKEIKKAEIQFKQKLSEVQEQYNSNVSQLGDVLKVKTREVASLQSVIMTEREKLQNVLLKLTEYDKLNNHNQRVQSEYKKKLEECQQHVASLNLEIKNLRNQKQSVIEVSELKAKFVLTLKEFDKLKEKYKILKKTNLKYKEYITEKDKHVESELKRIRASYQDSLMQQRSEYSSKRTNEKPTTKLLELESKYSEKMVHTQNGKKQQIS